MAERVRHEVVDDLLDPVGIRHNLIRVGGDLDAQEHAACVRVVFAAAQHVLEHALDVEHAHVERDRFVLVAREIQQVLHDAFEAPRLAVDRLEIPAAPIVIEHDLWHPERFDEAAHHRERRLQLVRHVREHLTTDLVGGSQRFVAGRELVGHPVERAGDSRDLVAAGLRRARAEIALSQSHRRILERGQPAPGGTEDDEGGRDRRQDQDDGPGQRQQAPDIPKDAAWRRWRQHDEPAQLLADLNGRRHDRARESRLRGGLS